MKLLENDIFEHCISELIKTSFDLYTVQVRIE